MSKKLQPSGYQIITITTDIDSGDIIQDEDSTLLTQILKREIEINKPILLKVIDEFNAFDTMGYAILQGSRANTLTLTLNGYNSVGQSEAFLVELYMDNDALAYACSQL